MPRTSDQVSYIIANYLQRNSLRVTNPPWVISKSPLEGLGIFSTRPIEIGEVIFIDHPVVLGPRSSSSCTPFCVKCFKGEELKGCERNCGLPVCSIVCQNDPQHIQECKIISQWKLGHHKVPEDQNFRPEVLKVLTPIRSLMLKDEDKSVIKCLKYHKARQHGFEVDLMKNDLGFKVKDDEESFMRLTCAVMDANAFELCVINEGLQTSVKGLYPLAALANHSCTPNTSHVFNDKQQMVVRASVFIPSDTEIFTSYSRNIWGTPSRQLHLSKTKHFICKCDRCADPTEFGSYLSAISCQICGIGKIIPCDPLKSLNRWRCDTCKRGFSGKDVVRVTSILGSTLNSFTGDDFQFMRRFLEEKLPKLVPENNETVTEIKYRVIWLLGYQQGFGWTGKNFNRQFQKYRIHVFQNLQKI